MKQIKVLGSGCAKCVKTAAVIQAIADEHGVPVNLVKETSAEVMMNYGVMSTPAVVVDEVVVHSGSIPDRKKVESWL
ncbi:thioredoxin family protein [Thalassolituus oleivorans]|jgi:small redox-active disulfide protein 2|nr:thioredoxin family protein [Thalassolituus oleivorans]AHK16265.1 glutaredoxin [Thalassolituus oleivorans R6-15]MBQ0727257.1 thioredoxin family protein [Thalassolituus oleivorans]MBQ0780323.1 thioredoxin family protein [Thalassolituus oleivorans]